MPYNDRLPKIKNIQRIKMYLLAFTTITNTAPQRQYPLVIISRELSSTTWILYMDVNT